MRDSLRVPPLADADATACVVYQVMSDVRLQLARVGCKRDPELVASYRRGLIWPVGRVTREHVPNIAEAAATEAAKYFAGRAVNAGPPAG